MTIYEIDKAFALCVDPETGVVIDFDMLMELQMERTKKCEHLATHLKNTIAFVSAIKDEEVKLKQKREAAEREVERMKQFLTDVLQGEKLKTPTVTVSYRKSVSVEIADGAVLPEEYQTVKTTISPDKTAIKSALQSGIQIDGCCLVEKQNIQIK